MGAQDDMAKRDVCVLNGDCRGDASKCIGASTTGYKDIRWPMRYLTLCDISRLVLALSHRKLIISEV